MYTFQRDTQCSSTDCLLMLRCQLYMFRTVTVHPQELLFRCCMCRLWYVLIHPAGTTFEEEAPEDGPLRSETCRADTWVLINNQCNYIVYLVGLYIYCNQDIIPICGGKPAEIRANIFRKVLWRCLRVKLNFQHQQSCPWQWHSLRWVLCVILTFVLTAAEAQLLGATQMWWIRGQRPENVTKDDRMRDNKLQKQQKW